MDVTERFPVVLLERTVVKNGRITPNITEKVCPKFSETVVKKEYGGGDSFWESSSDGAEVIPQNLGCLGEFALKQSAALKDEKPNVVSDLVVKIKSEREDSHEITRESIAYVRDIVATENLEFLQEVKLENQSISSKNEQVSENASPVSVYNGGTKTPNDSLNQTQTESTVYYDSSNVKLINMSIQLQDLFPSDLQRLGKAHSNTGICLCVYCQGQYRYVASSKSSKNSGLEPRHAVSSSKRQFECIQSPTKLNPGYELTSHLSSQNSGKRLNRITKTPSNDSLNRTKTESTMHYDSSNIKLKTMSVRLQDLFPSNLRQLGKAHSNTGICLCVYCQGQYRYVDSSKFSKNSDLEPRHEMFSSKRQSECIQKKFNPGYKLTSHLSTQKSGKSFHRQQYPANYKTQSASGDHQALLDERKFKCEHCFLEFSRNSALESHLKIVHDSDRPFKCKWCSGTFKDNSVLKIHLKMHSAKKAFKCEHCSRTFKWKLILKDHLKELSGDRVLKCTACPAKFPRRCDLLQHEKTHGGEGPNQCTQCSITSNSRSNFYSHLKTHSAKRPFKCKQCPAKFKMRSYLKIHARVHSDAKPFECAQCCAKFKQKGTIAIHLSTYHAVERLFKCKQCPADFKVDSHLKNHLRKHGVEKPFECDQCPAKFKWIASLSEHVIKHRVERPFKCEQCPASFKLKRHIVTHAKLHSEKKRFTCEQCHVKFRLKGTLLDHMKRHSDEKPFACKYCPAKFKHKSSLKIHILVHSDARPFQCTLCPKNFKRRIALTTHLRMHSGERPFRCKQCPAKFKYYSSLSIHRKVHSEERPFKCDQCAVSFKLKCNLSLHKRRAHSDERPIRCKQCPAKFKDSAYLKTHMRVHSGEKPFTCKQCLATFQQCSGLKRHLLKIHASDSSILCSYCAVKFTRNAELRKHMIVCEHRPTKLKKSSKQKSSSSNIADERQFSCALCSAKFKAKKVLKIHLMKHPSH